MKNSSSAAAVEAEPEDKTPYVYPGIQFDDEDFSSDERESEVTRQLIWEKLVVRLRKDISGSGMIHFEHGQKVLDYSI